MGETRKQRERLEAISKLNPEEVTVNLLVAFQELIRITNPIGLEEILRVFAVLRFYFQKHHKDIWWKRSKSG